MSRTILGIQGILRVDAKVPAYHLVLGSNRGDYVLLATVSREESLDGISRCFLRLDENELVSVGDNHDRTKDGDDFL